MKETRWILIAAFTVAALTILFGGGLAVYMMNKIIFASTDTDSPDGIPASLVAA